MELLEHSWGACIGVFGLFAIKYIWGFVIFLIFGCWGEGFGGVWGNLDGDWNCKMKGRRDEPSNDIFVTYGFVYQFCMSWLRMLQTRIFTGAAGSTT